MVSNNPSKSVESSGRPTWSNKWAFILAAAASAVGLGNMWRFPYLAAKYGGGTFLITYIVLLLTVGMTILLLEMSIGRKTRLSSIAAYKSYGKKYSFIGWIASSVPLIITPYYCIIGGWVVKYFVSYFYQSASSLADEGEHFTSFISSSWESYLFMFIFMAATFFVVCRGIRGGIEKSNLVMMPLLVLFALFLVIYVLTKPGAWEGVSYYLVPDLSKFSGELVLSALGQVFFSLSVAMGIMVTYGSYTEKKESLPAATVRIGGFDLLVSLLAGALIIPAIFVAFGSGETVAETAGPSLIFIILPQVFAQFGGFGNVVGVIFFALVIFAALTSAISLAETCVSIVQDGFKVTRQKALIYGLGWVFVVGIIINLGYNGFSFLEPLGEGTSLLDLADFVSNSIIMPISAFLSCIFVGWCIRYEDIEEDIMASSPFSLRSIWKVMVKIIAPIVIIIIFIWSVGQQFGWF